MIMPLITNNGKRGTRLSFNNVGVLQSSLQMGTDCTNCLYANCLYVKQMIQFCFLKLIGDCCSVFVFNLMLESVFPASALENVIYFRKAKSNHTVLPCLCSVVFLENVFGQFPLQQHEESVKHQFLKIILVPSQKQLTVCLFLCSCMRNGLWCYLHSLTGGIDLARFPRYAFVALPQLCFNLCSVYY